VERRDPHVASAAPIESVDHLKAGRAALDRGDWPAARVAFEAALQAREDPEALEGLGLSAWWLDLADVVFDTRERAYRAYLSSGDNVSAARIAVWIGWDCWSFRGEDVVGRGWLGRARRLLEDAPQCAEHAWLELREAAFFLFEDGDPRRAQAHADEGVKIARAAGDTDREMMGRALQGLALVTLGDVAEGMRRLDEVNAAIVAGELHDLVAIGLASCHMIAACDRVRDYDRAIQWCNRLKDFSARAGYRPLFAVCRTQYASICMWRGMWKEAEEELSAADRELAETRPGLIAEAVVRLADLRRKQGRLPEAERLFDRVAKSGLASVGLAEMAFDRGDHRGAAEQATRYLRRIPADNCSDRAEALYLLVRARTALRELPAAEDCAAELAQMAARADTTPLRALASLAAGHVAVGHGHADQARQHFEDAVDGFLRSGAPFEVARARLELAHALAGLGRTEAAADEARCALELLSELKAERELARARGVLESVLGSVPAPLAADADGPGSLTSPLSRREVEVLRLVADGLTNQEIAERLFLSDHTVHRHLANILNKLSVGSRAAAVARAAREGLLR
jgi:LuxR family transcriptional regulator, maltose regulon positive regulatory protein